MIQTPNKHLCYEELTLVFDDAIFFRNEVYFKKLTSNHLQSHASLFFPGPYGSMQQKAGMPSGSVQNGPPAGLGPQGDPYNTR